MARPHRQKFKNIREFSIALDLDRIAFTHDLILSEQKKITSILFTSLVFNTPVDQGEARGGWMLGIALPIDGNPQRLSPDGTSVIGQELSKLVQLVSPSKIFITNNVPYITVLDQGEFVPPDPGPSGDLRPGKEGAIRVTGGYSTQAPEGIVDPAIKELLELLVTAV